MTPKLIDIEHWVHACYVGLLKREKVRVINTEESSFLSYFGLFFFSHLPIISIPKAILAGALEECASIFRHATNYQQSLLSSLVMKATGMIILFPWRNHMFPFTITSHFAGYSGQCLARKVLEMWHCVFYQLLSEFYFCSPSDLIFSHWCNWVIDSGFK